MAELLDGMLGELADLVGLQATLAIVERWPGVRLYVPQPESLHGKHPLVQAIGQGKAETLAHHFQREEILVPRAVALLREARDRRIRAEYDPATGQSAPWLARRWHLSLRQVWYILSAEDRDDAGGAAAHVDTRQISLL